MDLCGDVIQALAAFLGIEVKKFSCVENVWFLLSA